MEKIRNLSKFIGNTPLLHFNVKYNDSTTNIYAKCEWFNYCGSVKDRAGILMIKNAGLKEGDEIVEVTSGNMGISLACLGAFLGLKVTIFMPKNMSSERKKLIRLYGAKLVICKNFEICFKKAENYSKKHNAVYIRQFENKYNKLAQKNIGKEIIKKIKPSAFVSGVGTGGTLMGAGGYLKKYGVKIIAIDPASSSLLTLGYKKGEHKIQGISDGIIPALYDKRIVDKIVLINDDDAIAMAQKLNKLGVPCGISGGANFLGCVLCGYKDVATVFADDNKKYLSTKLSTPVNSELVNNIEIKINNDWIGIQSLFI